MGRSGGFVEFLSPPIGSVSMRWDRMDEGRGRPGAPRPRPVRPESLGWPSKYLGDDVGDAAQSIQDFYTESDMFEAAHQDFQLALKHANLTENARNATMQSAVRMTMFKNALTGQSQALHGIDQNPQMTNVEKRKYTDIITGQMIATAQPA